MKTLNLKSLLLLFAFCITLHNFEEWLTMEKWMRVHPDLLPQFIRTMVQSGDFNALITIGLILTTVLTYAIIF
ncbi:MAG: hypothetical protein GXO77_10605, partial [Calditrichaeota bacterium]|nr:hypothetical protein [Calditrichota bacterium]